MASCASGKPQTGKDMVAWEVLGHFTVAEKGFTRMPVVERENRKFLGLISLDDLLKGRARHLEQERRRERPLRLKFLFGGDEVNTETREPAAR